MNFEILRVKFDNNFPKLLVASIILYLYKTAFWPLTYPYLVVQSLVLLIFIFRRKWELNLLGFIKIFKYPILLLLIILIATIVYNDFLNKTLLKDLVLMFLMFSLYFLLYWTSESLNARIPMRFTINFIIYTTLFVSVINLSYNLSLFHVPSELLTRFNISEGNTLAEDYNFFCLLIILGFVAINKYNSTFPEHKYHFFLISIFNVIFLVNIIFSTSRRGIIALVIVLLFFFITGISNAKKDLDFRKIINKLIMGIFILMGLYITGRYIVYNVPSHKISMMVFRYSNFLGKHNYEELNKELWEPSNGLPKVIDSASMINVFEIKPETWKSLNNNVKIYKIKNESVKQVRINVKDNDLKDAKIYSKNRGKIYFAKHTYQIKFKFKPINNIPFEDVRAGWLTDDGNMGNQITIAYNSIDSIGEGWYKYDAFYTFMDNHIGIAPFIMFISPECEYFISDFIIIDIDFSKKLWCEKYESNNSNEILKWVNLINPPIDDYSNLIMNGDFKYGFKFWDYSADSLKVSIESGDSINYARIKRGDGNGGYYSLFYSGRRVVFTKSNEYELSFKLKPISPHQIPFSVGFWIDEGDGYMNNLKLIIDTLPNGWLSVKTKFSFRNTLGNLVFPINSQIDNSEFLITNIALKNLTNPPDLSNKELETDTLKVQDVLFSGRNTRLKYANEIWHNKYSLLNKLFGKGFIYYEWFGRNFHNDQTLIDYPHNPLVSVLLYSGIVGVIIYFWVLHKTLSLYYAYRKKFGALLLCFLITFFFSFFSGSTPFDPPIMGFFMLLPFFTDYLYQKTKLHDA